MQDSIGALLQALGLTPVKAGQQPISLADILAHYGGGNMLQTKMPGYQGSDNALTNVLKAIMQGARSVGSEMPSNGAMNALGIAPIPPQLIQFIMQQVQGPQG